MRLYLLLFVFLVVPIALSYGVAPAMTLPKAPAKFRMKMEF